MSRKRLIAGGRFAASVVVLVVVLRRAHLDSLDLDWNANTIGWMVGAVVVTFAGVVLWAAGHPKLGGRLDANAGWRRFTGAVYFGVDRLRHRPADLVSVLLSGFAYQLAVVGAAYLAAEGLGLNLGPTALLAFVPA